MIAATSTAPSPRVARASAAGQPAVRDGRRRDLQAGVPHRARVEGRAVGPGHGVDRQLLAAAARAGGTVGAGRARARPISTTAMTAASADGASNGDGRRTPGGSVRWRCAPGLSGPSAATTSRARRGHSGLRTPRVSPPSAMAHDVGPLQPAQPAGHRDGTAPPSASVPLGGRDGAHGQARDLVGERRHDVRRDPGGRVAAGLGGLGGRSAAGGSEAGSEAAAAPASDRGLRPRRPRRGAQRAPRARPRAARAGRRRVGRQARAGRSPVAADRAARRSRRTRCPHAEDAQVVLGEHAPEDRGRPDHARSTRDGRTRPGRPRVPRGRPRPPRPRRPAGPPAR